MAHTVDDLVCKNIRTFPLQWVHEGKQIAARKRSKTMSLYKASNAPALKLVPQPEATIQDCIVAVALCVAHDLAHGSPLFGRLLMACLCEQA